jgi:3'-phosphoadenosine 5'-phosphosulfate sulfotransferase (PAPS reductase)/FAD synthetase
LPVGASCSARRTSGTTDALGDAWADVALDQIVVTPPAEIARLTGSQREHRLANLMKLSDRIIVEGIDALFRGRTIVAQAVLYSGGNDSTTLLHAVRGSATHAIHANTGIGIARTRQFVRETCDDWGVPLIEKTPPVSYRDLMLERGFPGPQQHWKMYSRLKERCLDAARYDLGVANKRKVAAVFLAGRRREESKRRSMVPLWEPDGSVIWISPLAFHTKLDLNTYRLVHRDVPRNPVADLIHMSGECLCGSFAHPGELAEIGEWFPEAVAEIRELERDVEAAGVPYPLNVWGWGADPEMKKLGTVLAHQLGENLRAGSGPLCTSCDARAHGGEIVGGEAT